MANEFAIQRTAVGSFTLSGAVTAATTHSSGVFIPAGALITGIRIGAAVSNTIAGASGTVAPRVGTVAIAATLNVKNLPAQTKGLQTAVLTNGMMILAEGELNLIVGTSNNATAAGTWDYYVDYLYVNS